MTTTPRQADDGPPMQPPRWKASRGPRGCGGNLVLILIGLFGVLVAGCLISGGLVDSVVRKVLADGAANDVRTAEELPGFHPAPILPVRRGLLPDSPEVRPRESEVVPANAPKEDKPKGGGINEDKLFGVQ